MCILTATWTLVCTLPCWHCPCSCRNLAASQCWLPSFSVLHNKRGNSSSANTLDSMCTWLTISAEKPPLQTTCCTALTSIALEKRTVLLRLFRLLQCNWWGICSTRRVQVSHPWWLFLCCTASHCAPAPNSSITACGRDDSGSHVIYVNRLCSFVYKIHMGLKGAYYVVGLDT